MAEPLDRRRPDRRHLERPRLDHRQQALLDAWLPGHAVVADLGWAQADRVVLRLRLGRRDLVVKASGAGDEHTRREIEAHLAWTASLVGAGRAPRMRFWDEAARILVADFLPGTLVSGSPARDDPEVYRQAGALLALLHRELGTDPHYVSRLRQRTLGWLDSANRIDADTTQRLRAEVSVWEAEPVRLVSCHADFQPRNWLVHEGVVSVIDFGGMEPGPAMLDWVRVFRNDAARRTELGEAFAAGYGSDPRREPLWRQLNLAEAVATAAWAHQVGDRAFEAQGLGWLAGLAGENPSGTPARMQ